MEDTDVTNVEDAAIRSNSGEMPLIASSAKDRPSTPSIKAVRGRGFGMEMDRLPSSLPPAFLGKFMAGGQMQSPRPSMVTGRGWTHSVGGTPSIGLPVKQIRPVGIRVLPSAPPPPPPKNEFNKKHQYSESDVSKEQQRSKNEFSKKHQYSESEFSIRNIGTVRASSVKNTSTGVAAGRHE
jgi:hypothetical protein